ncbi:hypothetical protein CVD28_17740 [Bacillus sp. M6-12]|uniref:hypothetical protein n=1 Tax=Bacillus sp. M6-12 TaxID=2054166 RepID=UPI000C78BBF3|nr:hypothetical protein [Bacillus sp. M6-12]PLS16313.1 hypothetical protein CVD28_17740 [Bacillus sp. M6-12]
MAVKMIPRQEILELLSEIEASIERLETNLEKSVERERGLIMQNNRNITEGVQLKIRKVRITAEAAGSQKLQTIGKPISIKPNLSY